MAALLENKGIAKEAYDTIGEADKKAVQSEVMKLAKEGYLT